MRLALALTLSNVLLVVAPAVAQEVVAESTSPRPESPRRPFEAPSAEGSESTLDASTSAERVTESVVTSDHRRPASIASPTRADDPTRFELGAQVEALFESFTGERTVASLLVLVFSFALAIVLALALRHVRESLPERGLFPALLAFLHLAMRLLVVALALLLVLRALPDRLSVVVLFGFVAVAFALGWSVRDFLPDLVAGFVLVFERHVRRGTWVSATGFAGQVERLGFRSTLLRDAQGRRVDVPNRHLLTSPVTSGGHHEREHEVEVSLPTTLPAAVVRGSLRDAVLASPWVFPGADAVVLRDPDQPTRWRVRGRLLEAGFGARFEGELLERAEALLTVAGGRLEVLDRSSDPLDAPSRTRKPPDEPEPET